ncbi:anaphase-promoting complex subunit 4 isoform X2 [Iris pallida]|uniref:Anaphase-promoting complex subunit 4 isoform X2 n=1 Tax=Iris pallida TaxID=29817 RepID=A0AAX6GN64_IRIPA|nr:anaphase-promoting complex subunit 4 isoform X2 [Iris pallida]
MMFGMDKSNHHNLCFLMYIHVCLGMCIYCNIYIVILWLIVLVYSTSFQFQNFFNWLSKCIKILQSEQIDQIQPPNRFD